MCTNSRHARIHCAGKPDQFSPCTNPPLTKRHLSSLCPAQTSESRPVCPALRASASPKVTDLRCRRPSPTLFQVRPYTHWPSLSLSLSRSFSPSPEGPPPPPTRGMARRPTGAKGPLPRPPTPRGTVGAPGPDPQGGLSEPPAPTPWGTVATPHVDFSAQPSRSRTRVV